MPWARRSSIITRNVDLSTGSILGLSAFLAGDLLSEHPGLALPVVFLLGIALGAACGLLNGVLVTWGRVPALVVTLGTLYVFRGLAFLWTDGRQVNAETLPDAFLNIGSESIAGIPILVLFALVIVLVVGQWLRDYRPGRELYAIGSNPDGARLAGVRSGRRVLVAFLLSGALSGLGGVLFTARFGTVDATAGVGYELTVIAAAVVGGVAIFGGVGSVYGAALGALLLGTITSSLIVLRIEALLAAGGDRCSAADRDRPRPAARRPRRGHPETEERASCELRRRHRRARRPRPPSPGATGAPCSGGGRRCSWACWWSRRSPARRSRPSS